MNEDSIKYYIKENERRQLIRSMPYDPIRGVGSDVCERRLLHCKGLYIEKSYLPVQAFNDPVIKRLQEYGSVQQLIASAGIRISEDTIDEVNRAYIKARIKYDPEFWFASFVYIKDKESDKDIKFIPNRGQRKLLKVLMTMWFNNEPMRIILCKARQWGGSTLIQIFMIWIQLVHKEQWHSVIAAHKENTSKIIRGMYTKLLRHYPTWLLDCEESQLKLLPFENSQKTRQLHQRKCRITVGSAEQPNSILGDDISMAHLSEVGLWVTTQGKKPEELAQSVMSGILLKPKTLIALESTARGVGNFYHREWVRANKPKTDEEYSGYTPVFVAWWEIDLYQTPIPQRRLNKFIASLTEDEIELFNMGATLEGLYWRRAAKRQMSDDWRFKMEYPSTPLEAFQSTGRRWYPAKDVARLRQGCTLPTFIGDIVGDDVTGVNSLKNIRFVAHEQGYLKVWQMPDSSPVRNRYVVVVDIGGLGNKSDRSVICVIDRYWQMEGGVPEVVAEWCGHIDHDMLAWKAVQMAKQYKDALLIIESNTLETEQTEGDHFEYILDEIASVYDNLFCRTPPDKITAGVPPRWGFHTNRSSKQMVCDHHKKVLRENMYYEPCAECCDEYDTFEVKPNGSLGAIDGSHDDRNITRCIGIWACYHHMDAPRVYEVYTNTNSSFNDYAGYSSF
jgi:hypothetical protein